MITGMSRIAFFLLFIVTMVAPYAWAQGSDVSIVYSNNVNGQVYPAG